MLATQPKMLRPHCFACLVILCAISRVASQDLLVPSPKLPTELMGQPAAAANGTHDATGSSNTTSNQEATAKLLLTNALRQSVWGPAVASRVRQSVALLDQRLFGVGQYAHGGGNAWGKLKLSIRIPAGDQVNTLQQVSDGRVLYTTRHMGDESEAGKVLIERSRVNIERVRESLGTITRADFEDPIVALHLSIGGQPELLRALCQQYHWYSARPGKLADVDVWWLRGKRSTDGAPLHGQTEIDHQLTAQDSLALVPDHVQIAIGRSQPLPYWLYRVEQSKSDIRVGGRSNGSLVTTLEFLQPQIVPQMPEELFEDGDAKLSSNPIIDETKKYLPPTRTVAQLPQSSETR